MCTYFGENVCVHIVLDVLEYNGVIKMAYTKEAYEAAKKYKNEKIKRVPLDMQREDYEVLKMAADARGEKVNEFIKKAIRERLDRENLPGVLKTVEDDDSL